MTVSKQSERAMADGLDTAVCMATATLHEDPQALYQLIDTLNPNERLHVLLGAVNIIRCLIDSSPGGRDEWPVIAQHITTTNPHRQAPDEPS